MTKILYCSINKRKEKKNKTQQTKSGRFRFTSRSPNLLLIQLPTKDFWVWSILECFNFYVLPYYSNFQAIFSFLMYDYSYTLYNVPVLK